MKFKICFQKFLDSAAEFMPREFYSLTKANDKAQFEKQDFL